MKTVSPFSDQLLQKDLPLVTEEASHLVEFSPSDKGKDVSEALNVDNGLSTGKEPLGGGCGAGSRAGRPEAQRRPSETWEGCAWLQGSRCFWGRLRLVP